MPAPSERPTERYRFLGAVMGLLSAAVAIAVAHLVAGFVGREASPVIAVGSTAIDLTPEWLKSFAIRTFGSNDKTVLLIGIGLVLAIVAAVLGMASVRNRSIGLIGLTVFGLLGMVAAVTRPTGSAVDALPSLVGAVAGAATLVFLHARLPQEHCRGCSAFARDRGRTAPVPAGWSRRGGHGLRRGRRGAVLRAEVRSR